MTVPRTTTVRGPEIRRRPTRARQRVLDAIVELGAESGHPPTFREVAARVGISVGTVHDHVRRLVADGWVTQRDGRARTLMRLKAGSGV